MRNIQNAFEWWKVYTHYIFYTTPLLISHKWVFSISRNSTPQFNPKSKLLNSYNVYCSWIEVKYFVTSLTEAQPRSNILHLPKPEGWWHKYLIEIYEKYKILSFSVKVNSLNYLFCIFFHCKKIGISHFHMWPLLYRKNNVYFS